jgi:eukaryotic-like serine/threonine-protein kinase
MVYQGTGHSGYNTIPAARRVMVFLVLVSLCIVLSPVTATVFTYPGNFSNTTLQDLVNTAENDDTILLQGGTYHENLVINKSISLIGTDTDKTPEIISGDGLTGITLNANGIVIDGVTMTGTTGYGILVKTDNNKIQNSTITGFERGIGLVSAMHNEISNNSLVNNSVGIYVDSNSQINKVFLNYFDNPVNVLSQSAVIMWNSNPWEYQYAGQDQSGILGNFWKPYMGEDANGDGIGDVPYIVQNSGSGTIGNFMVPDNGGNASDAITRKIPYLVPNAGPGVSGNQMESASITDYAPLVSPPGSYELLKAADVPVSVPQAGQPLNSNPFSSGPGSSLTQPPPFPANFGPLWWIIPIIVVLSAVAGVWYERTWWRKRHEKADARSGTQSRNVTVVNPTSYQGAGPEEHRHYAARLPPTLEEKYPDAEYMGEGGVGRVFRAKDAEGRTVAIKVPIRFDEVTGTHFTKELQLWQGLHHRNIVEIYSANIFPVPYIEIEYYRTSLAELPLPLELKKSVEIITGVAEGLLYAHERGIIHRDIKPENVLLSDEGVPKITDWGLAKALTDTRQTALISFSPDFAAPEQLAPNLYGDTGPWTDIYQLGVLFYNLVTGEVPFRGDGIAEVMNAILYKDPVLPQLPGTEGTIIQNIIYKCMEKKPPDRYNSVAEILADLKKIT